MKIMVQFQIVKPIVLWVLGALRQCEHFRSKIWSHPCEKKLSNYHIENALLISEAENPLPLQNTLLFSDDSDNDIDVFSYTVKRTTRSPMATEIQQWRHQLNTGICNFIYMQMKITSELPITIHYNYIAKNFHF